MNVQMAALLEQLRDNRDVDACLAGYDALIAHHTTPLGLNQWQPSDKPAMAQFNSDNSIIDEALRGLAAGKADAAYVDAAVAGKADVAYVDAGLETKADTAYVDQAVAGMACDVDKAYVDEGLAAKADRDYVDSELQAKTDKFQPITEYSLPLVNGYFPNGYCGYWKNQFNEVTVVCTIAKNPKIINGETVMTLPAGYRPKSTLLISANTGNLSVSNALGLTVTNTGNVVVRLVGSDDNTINGTFSFIATN